MAKHARLGLSNTRWPKCPGSIREEAAYPNDTNPAAIDGTGTHLGLEMCLDDGKEPETLLDITIGVGHKDHPKGWVVKHDRIDRIKVATSYINRRTYEENFTGMYTEQKVNPGNQFKRNDWWGTSDVILFNDHVLEVIDYKDGQMWVSEKDNSQLIGNGFGALCLCEQHNPESDIQKIRMTIIQPKTSQPIRFVEMTKDELRKEAEILAEAAEKTDDPNAPLIQGDWCTWCKHGRAGNCSAKVAKATDGIKAMVKDVPVLDQIIENQIVPKDMTDDQIKEIMDAEPLITKMLESVNEEAFRRLESGKQIDGYGIGNGRSSNQWNCDEDMVEKKLKGFRVKKADIYPSKLISPAQALKLECLTDKQKEKIQENMIESVPGRQKVVRVKIQKPSVDEMFGTKPEEKPATLSFM